MRIITFFEHFCFILNGHCMHACCQMTKQISRGFRACLGVKKILKVYLEICPGTPPTFNKTTEDGNFFFERPYRACSLSEEQTN